MMRPFTLLAGLCLFWLVACAAPADRNPSENTEVAKGFPSRAVTDVVILPPRLGTPDDELLAARFRVAAREVLIDQKLYAVPQDDYVDQALRSLPQATSTPARTLETTGSDAALEIVVSQWDTAELIPRGRLHAGGEMTLHGPSGVLWKGTFRDKMLLAPRSVTSANLSEMLEGLVRRLTREVMSTMPPKPRE